MWLANMFIRLILIVVKPHYQITYEFGFIYMDTQLMYYVNDKKPYCLPSL